MLLFIDTLAHSLETPFLLDRLYEGSVYDQVAERRTVLVASGCCGAREVVVMRRAQKEDALAIMVSETVFQQAERFLTYASAQAALL